MEEFYIFSDYIDFHGEYFQESGDVEWNLSGNSLTDIRCWLMERTDKLIEWLSSVEAYEEKYFDVFESFISEKDITEYIIENDEYERA